MTNNMDIENVYSMNCNYSEPSYYTCFLARTIETLEGKKHLNIRVKGYEVRLNTGAVKKMKMDNGSSYIRLHNNVTCTLVEYELNPKKIVPTYNVDSLECKAGQRLWG